jgi:hypothetical protein
MRPALVTTSATPAASLTQTMKWNSLATARCCRMWAVAPKAGCGMMLAVPIRCCKCARTSSKTWLNSCSVCYRSNSCKVRLP